MTSRRRPMGWVYFTGWVLYRTLFRFYLRWRVYHAERVPLDGPAILASNHASFLDPPLIGSALHRPINYLAKESLFQFPIAGWILRRCDAIPVDREGGGARGLKALLDRLLKGKAIILFPEGTRTRDGNLGHARSGIGLTVIKSRAPVVPIRVFGTFAALGAGKLVIRPRQVSVVFGEPLNFEKERAEAAECSKERLKQIYQEVANRIMAEIGKLRIPEKT